MTQAFLPAYIRIASSTLANDFTDNYDTQRFGPAKIEPISPRTFFRQQLSRILNAAGLVKAWEARNTLGAAVALVAPHLDQLEWLYQRVGDEESRQLLLQVLAYRALGHRRVKLPLNTPDRLSALAKLEELSRGAESIDLGFMHFQARKFDLAAFGYPIELFATVGTVIAQFQFQQYRCAAGGQVIDVEAGDIVVDAGGCYGDTALYFAHKVGATGRIYSFEFLPENIAIFRRNLALNQLLAERIKVIELPLWSHSGEILFIEGTGPGTRVSTSSTNANAGRVETTCIDDVVRQESLPRVDFIKMDIEGAELESLKGAEATIRAHRPKLAISVYHRLSDFWTIPKYIDQLGLGYQFHLRHFTIHAEETVIFAEAPR